MDLFPLTRDEGQRAFAKEYTQTVARLIRNGSWFEMPAPEDQLPDDWMPKAFLNTGRVGRRPAAAFPGRA